MPELFQMARFALSSGLLMIWPLTILPSASICFNSLILYDLEGLLEESDKRSIQGLTFGLKSFK